MWRPTRWSGVRGRGVRGCAGGDDGVDVVGGYGSGGIDELFVSGAGTGHGQPGRPVFERCIGDDGVRIAAALADLVAAYAFDEGTGTTVADLSGNGNNGQIGAATWTTSGKYGKALTFNGTSARVQVPIRNPWT